MGLGTTIVVLLAAVALLTFATWKVRRPPPPGELRWIPYGGLQFVAILVVVLMLAHLVTLATGVPLTGRLMR